MADDSTAARIAADYPYLSEADQARAVEISNTCSGLMSLAMDANVFPQPVHRSSYGQQISQLRQSLISALAQK